MRAEYVYLIAVSVIAMLLTVYDKRAAIAGRRRISEKMLFFTAVIGGGAAMYLTMKSVRHKTKHKRFMIGLPCIMILQIAAAAAVWYIKCRT